jgi:phosphotransferase system enzyme I (PtsI)
MEKMKKKPLWQSPRLSKKYFKLRGKLMTTYQGKSVYKGVAIGPIHVIEQQDSKINFEIIESVTDEIKRLDDSVVQAQAQLKMLYDKALVELGEEDAEIFNMHQMLIEDEDYIDAIHESIETKKCNAEYAVSEVGKEFAQMFSDMDDKYMNARSADVLDISNRLVKTLLGFSTNTSELEVPSIIVADDLNPSMTMEFDKSKVLAFVMKKGSLNSHTAILARNMNIPALVMTNFESTNDFKGSSAVVDGNKGFFYINPSDEILTKTEKELELQIEKRKIEEQYKGRESKTIDGHKINIYGNIGDVGDVDDVISYDGEGIGLFRSEFLFLGRTSCPMEDEQFAAYKKVLVRMKNKPVIVRTLDIGADKKVDYFNLDAEENPAMGYRAIRICLDRPELFKTQLRALLRASVYGDLSIMYPMIISVKEWKDIKSIMSEVIEELESKLIEFKIPKQGIMIETPAAVMISDLLAKEVDFFSIGTNDLTQYMLAIDRQNSKLDELCDTHHIAILRSIEMVCRNAQKENIWVGICGELGADTSLTEKFIKMGVSELSVAPPCILEVRKTVCETSIN